MKQRATKARLTADMVGRGVSGLLLSGSAATAVAVTGWWAMEPGGAGISLPGFTILMLVIILPSVIVWGLGSVFVALPLWAGLHALGMRNWPTPVTCGAGLVGPIWFLVTHDWTAGAAGALAGAFAGWGLWWSAYGRGGTER